MVFIAIFFAMRGKPDPRSLKMVESTMPSEEPPHRSAMNPVVSQVASDADRDAAEWIIRHGVSVEVEGQGGVAKVTDLPVAPFTIRQAWIVNVADFTEADAQRPG